MKSQSDIGQAVVCNPADDEFKSACLAALQQEWSALQQYLSTVGPAWHIIVNRWAITQSTHSGHWKHLALPLLVGRRSAAQHAENGGEAVSRTWERWLERDQLIEARSALDGETVQVIASHPACEEEAGELSHPEVNQSVQLLGKLPDGYSERLKEALRLVDLAGGRSRNVVTVGLGALVLLELPSASPEGACISFTSRGAPGAIFLTLTAPILLAETIIHESVHSVLYAATRLSPVTLGGRARLSSPLRRDPRPLEGVVHQALVLDYLCGFYEALLENESIEPVSRNVLQIRQRLARCRKDRDAAVAVVLSVKSDLGPLGLSVIDAVRAEKN